MKSTTFIFALAFMLFALPATAQQSNVFANLPLEVLADTWLTRNCGVDDEPVLTNVVARRGEALVPLFMSAWRDGPSEVKLRETRSAAAERFQKSRGVLEDAESLGLSSDNLGRAKARTEEEFVTRAVESLDMLYRSQALKGLLLVGGDEGRQIVEDTAADTTSPFNSTAVLLLEDADED